MSEISTQKSPRWDLADFFSRKSHRGDLVCNFMTQVPPGGPGGFLIQKSHRGDLADYFTEKSHQGDLVCNFMTQVPPGGLCYFSRTMRKMTKVGENKPEGLAMEFSAV